MKCMVFLKKGMNSIWEKKKVLHHICICIKFWPSNINVYTLFGISLLGFMLIPMGFGASKDVVIPPS